VLLVEMIRILIASVLNKPSSEQALLQRQREDANAELASIKSVQLELVRHSKLTRKIIKMDKQIEDLQAGNAPKFQRARRVGRISKVLAELLLCLYYLNSNVVLIDPKVLWPLSIFISHKTISLPLWFFVVSSSLSCRYVLRTILQLVFRGAEFA